MELWHTGTQSDSRQTLTKGRRFHKMIRMEGPLKCLRFDSSEVERPQVTFHQTENLLISHRLRTPVSCSTWADRSETVGSLCYKLLTYFGIQDTGAHGLVCVPSVPETLPHFGGRVGGGRGSGWCNHTNKAGLGCVWRSWSSSVSPPTRPQGEYS